QAYLMAAHSLGAGGDAVTSGALAERLGASPSSVTEGVRKLVSLGLAVHRPYAPVELTDAGHGFAVAMVRRHRILETFLARCLDYPWDAVHAEADALEHVVSDRFVDALDVYLDHPRRDPQATPSRRATAASTHWATCRWTRSPRGPPASSRACPTATTPSCGTSPRSACGPTPRSRSAPDRSSWGSSPWSSGARPCRSARPSPRRCGSGWPVRTTTRSGPERPPVTQVPETSPRTAPVAATSAPRAASTSSSRRVLRPQSGFTHSLSAGIAATASRSSSAISPSAGTR